MAAVPHILEGAPPNLRRQLAVAVRSIQWSYAIFWSISAGQLGVLEWGDGFYNGDIRTRRTCQGVELDADQLGLQRSEQLRDLYKSLAASAAGDANLPDKRPSAALSPEDLTEMEWYYLVCMSFVFNVGEGLPGTALANGQPIWLCNAHIANSKVFSRSLLAKSASIQTVVCFPLVKGVVELGVNELVSEDPNLIQNIKAIFLKNSYPVAVKESNLVSDNLDTDDNLKCVELDCEIFSSILSPVAEYEEVKTSSPDENSNGIGLNQTNEAFLVKRINGGAASSVQSWHFVDEDFSRGNHNAMEFSDCTSQTFVNSEKIISFPSCERVRNYPSPPKSQDCNEVHYQRVLLTLLKGPHQLTLGPYFRNCNKASSFVSWKKEGLEDFQKPRRRSSQRLLKKVLFEIAYMHNGVLVQSYGDDGANQNDSWRLEGCEAGMDQILVKRRWREKINEKFVILKSLVPSVCEADDVSILDDTIDYLKGLKRRISELEEREITGPNDIVERTSDDRFGNGKKSLMNKRKACELDELSDIDLILLKNGAIDDVTVSVIEKDVLIEIRCPWRECLLLDIVDSLSNLRLDTHSVQSSTADGLLSLSFKSKFKGSDVLTAAKLKRAIQSVVRQF